MEYAVREAELDDGETLLELWHGFTSYLSEFDERYEHKAEADERWLRYFENQLVDSKYGTVLLAEVDGEIVGVLEARIVGNHPIFRLENHGHVHGLFVRERYRGEGIGSALLDRAAAWFESEPRSADFYRINLLEGDDDAQKRLESYGLDPVERLYEKQL